MDSIEWDLEYSRFQHGSQIIIAWLVLRRFAVICFAYGYALMGGVILDLQSIMKMLCWSPCGEMFLFRMLRIDHFITLQWQNADIPQWEMSMLGSLRIHEPRRHNCFLIFSRPFHEHGQTFLADRFSPAL